MEAPRPRPVRVLRFDVMLVPRSHHPSANTLQLAPVHYCRWVALLGLACAHVERRLGRPVPRPPVLGGGLARES